MSELHQQADALSREFDRVSSTSYRSVKSTLLDILLLRASGWNSDEQGTGNELPEDEVLVENDVTEEQQQEGTGDQGGNEGIEIYEI